MGKYGNGAKVGNLTVFNRDGAIKAYKIFCDLFARDMTLEASAAMSDAADDLCKLGFTHEEIEQIELSAY